MTNKIICITPTRNEVWIIKRFFQCASMWADRIVVADQMSTDGSRTVIKKNSKTVLINNNTHSFNERIRINLMMDEVRKIEGRKVLLALDADEMLTSNFEQSNEWNIIQNAGPGVAFAFDRVNILPDMKRYWIEPNKLFGVVDDGHGGSFDIIHGERLPIASKENVINLKEIKVLHYQYTNTTRMSMKQCWYQIWHSLTQEPLRPLDMYRLYHPLERVRDDEIFEMRKEWTAHYEDRGVDMFSLEESKFWGINEILSYLEKCGPEKFRKLGIWKFDWEKIALNEKFAHKRSFKDPRSVYEKIIHRWCSLSQKDPWSLGNKVVARILRIFGW